MTRHLYPRLPPSPFDRATLAFRDILLDHVNDFAAQAKDVETKPGEGIAAVIAVFLAISARFSQGTHSRAQWLEACARAYDVVNQERRP